MIRPARALFIAVEDTIEISVYTYPHTGTPGCAGEGEPIPGVDKLRL
jgi:hypothetical protein